MSGFVRAIQTPEVDQQFLPNSLSSGRGAKMAISDTAALAHYPINFPADRFQYRVIKRGLDLCCIVVALPIIVPLMIVVAVMVKLNTSGPIFFSQSRVRGKSMSFRIFKFRTMSVNADEVLKEHLANNVAARIEWHETHKLRSDPRVSKLGSLLRRYSLDELPQIWNVLKGDMSIIGPRPIIRAEIAKYGSRFACYCRVKPGLSGLWQVSGRNTTSYPQRVSLDCEYVNHWSLVLDLKIMLRSVSTVISRRGAF